MRARLLYTLIFIFCMSAFASSKNECAHPLRDSNPCTGSGKGRPSREVTKDISGEGEEFSTFQFAKLLYI